MYTAVKMQTNLDLPTNGSSYGNEPSDIGQGCGMGEPNEQRRDFLGSAVRGLREASEPLRACPQQSSLLREQIAFVRFVFLDDFLDKIANRPACVWQLYLVWGSFRSVSFVSQWVSGSKQGWYIGHVLRKSAL